MPVPAYQDLITLTSTANGLIAESMEERILSVLAMLASGTAPDGTALTLVAGSLRISGLPAFVAGDHYLVADSSGNVHLSALGPAS
jgi:hypothetical protein